MSYRDTIKTDDTKGDFDMTTNHDPQQIADGYLKSLKDALETFGTYSFDDKGPMEVMEVPSAELAAMRPESAFAVLSAMQDARNYPDHVLERVDTLIDKIILGLHRQPDAWWYRLVELDKEGGRGFVEPKPNGSSKPIPITRRCLTISNLLETTAKREADDAE